MSSTSIPNLNTFQKAGRGRGRLGDDKQNVILPDKDTVVRGTDDDAATSRMSAVKAGYLEDPFAEHLSSGQWQRRLPLMNRGTYVRTTAIDRVVDRFLFTVEGKKQIISLGAGSDTRYFRIRANQKACNLIYHEVDFSDNNKRKLQRLFAPACLKVIDEMCGIDLKAAQKSDDELMSNDYCIHSLDLRCLDAQCLLKTFAAELPTLIISECCLVYLSPEEADRVLDTFVEGLTSSTTAIVIYEPINPNTAFGRTMTRNLVSRGIHLQTIQKYADLQAQARRLQSRGLQQETHDINSIWQQWVSTDEKTRIDKLEWMDEVEEFVLLAKHYCLSIGYRGMVDFDLTARQELKQG
ncbi:hypothetical protein BT93_L0129 [Corymbia citriodora subsp. variegata]|uniref:Leucine carboxyl methyltransferase 1 homolog n=1 Tax=Corymbia citriodora subsp. variegata TaxID=360336 RepID=A0A8T0CEV6_CORYI|nr:hypothetical protein BT93_L0129 [Corymbia citriodora subsp. variegata]